MDSNIFRFLNIVRRKATWSTKRHEPGRISHAQLSQLGLTQNNYESQYTDIVF